MLFTHRVDTCNAARRAQCKQCSYADCTSFQQNRKRRDIEQESCAAAYVAAATSSDRQRRQTPALQQVVRTSEQMLQCGDVVCFAVRRRSEQTCYAMKRRQQLRPARHRPPSLSHWQRHHWRLALRHCLSTPAALSPSTSQPLQGTGVNLLPYHHKTKLQQQQLYNKL